MGAPGRVVGDSRRPSIRAALPGRWVRQPFGGFIRRCLMADCADV